MYQTLIPQIVQAMQTSDCNETEDDFYNIYEIASW